MIARRERDESTNSLARFVSGAVWSFALRPKLVELLICVPFATRKSFKRAQKTTTIRFSVFLGWAVNVCCVRVRVCGNVETTENNNKIVWSQFISSLFFRLSRRQRFRLMNGSRLVMHAVSPITRSLIAFSTNFVSTAGNILFYFLKRNFAQFGSAGWK